VAALARAGTRLVFGVPGGGPNLDVVGAAEAAGLRFVLAHGETAATIMAAASADLTGAPGAVVVTRGPGLASAVNGIAHAALDRLPVVVIADTVADTRISHQRIDQEALGRSVAKAAFTVGGPPAAAAAVAARAVGIALAAPAGPVIANTADGAADQHGPPRVENGVEAQTLRAAAKDTAARAGRAILAEAVRGRGGRCCCSARARSRGPRRSGTHWTAAVSRRCTPTGPAACCRTLAPRRPGWSPGARWSGRCSARPT
jgi:acetolactate synthase-1/2/3 large subunit